MAQVPGPAVTSPATEAGPAQTDAPSAPRQQGRTAGGQSTRTETTARILGQLTRTSDPAIRQQLGEQLVVRNMPVAESIAAGFRHRGVADEDLRQVAYLALVKAVRRYDETVSGADFLSYAVPTIKGELRQHFRDHGWVIRPPRRIQELQRALHQARQDLETSLGRAPLTEELAAHLGEGEPDVREALSTHGCYRPTSLDAPAADGPDPSTPLGHHIGHDERGWEGVEARAVLRRASADLSPRDQEILFLRFFEGRSQREIGQDLGITQMHVSRLLVQILARMRERIDEAHGYRPDLQIA